MFYCPIVLRPKPKNAYYYQNQNKDACSAPSKEAGDCGSIDYTCVDHTCHANEVPVVFGTWGRTLRNHAANLMTPLNLTPSPRPCKTFGRSFFTARSLGTSRTRLSLRTLDLLPLLLPESPKLTLPLETQSAMSTMKPDTLPLAHRTGTPPPTRPPPRASYRGEGKLGIRMEYSRP